MPDTPITNHGRPTEASTYYLALLLAAVGDPKLTDNEQLRRVWLYVWRQHHPGEIGPADIKRSYTAARATARRLLALHHVAQIALAYASLTPPHPI